MKNKILFILVAILMIFANNSCKRDFQENISFDSIEREFGFKNFFSNISKERVLKSYGNLENYNRILSMQVQKIAKKRKKHLS